MEKVKKLNLIFFVAGILFGLFALFGFSYSYSVYKKTNHKTLVQSNKNKDVQYKYDKNGKYIGTIIDRNHDGKPDQWFYYSDDNLDKIVADANFDGKEDRWTKMIGLDSSVSEIDVDSNGIPDETAYYKYQECQYIVFHPNGSKATQIYFQKQGILDYMLFFPDSSGRFQKIRKFDKYGNVFSEDKYIQQKF